MARDLEQRKRFFRAALALAGMSAAAFAEQQGVSRSHVYEVLSGRESGRLEAEIEAFISKYFPQSMQNPESAQDTEC